MIRFFVFRPTPFMLKIKKKMLIGENAFFLYFNILNKEVDLVGFTTI